MESAGRSGSRRTTKRRAILDGTERLMLTEGYGAVTYRSVATVAGVAPGLVQYYFPSIDLLFVAVLREATDRLIDQLTEAAHSDRPLHAIWAYASDPAGSALLLQFMALANAIPEVGSVIGEGGERVRHALVGELSAKWARYGLDGAAPNVSRTVAGHRHRPHRRTRVDRGLPRSCRTRKLLSRSAAFCPVGVDLQRRLRSCYAVV
jgi:AcrR family transcriptional regulator